MGRSENDMLRNRPGNDTPSGDDGSDILKGDDGTDRVVSDCADAPETNYTTDFDADIDLTRIAIDELGDLTFRPTMAVPTRVSYSNWIGLMLWDMSSATSESADLLVCRRPAKAASRP